MKVSLNLRGPSRKAKYSLVTDSEPSSASERWEEPRQGEDSEPETTCLQAVRALLSNLPPRSFFVYRSECPGLGFVPSADPVSVKRGEGLAVGC